MMQGKSSTQQMGMCPKCREYGTVKLAEVPVEAPPTKAATGSQGVILGMRSKSLNKAKTEMEERKIEERLMRSAATSTSGASASSSWFSSGDSGDLPESLERIGETMRGKKQRFQLKSKPRSSLHLYIIVVLLLNLSRKRGPNTVENFHKIAKLWYRSSRPGTESDFWRGVKPRVVRTYRWIAWYRVRRP